MRTIGVDQRRTRLALRHRLHPQARATEPETAARSVLCLHATDPATVYLSAWARVAGFTLEDMDRALYADRTLVRHLAMRRTLFGVPRETLPVVHAAASLRVADAESRRLAREVEKAGLHEDGAGWLERACAGVLEALADGREATSSELREELPLLRGSIVYGVGRTWGGEVPIGPRVLTVLSARGEIVRASNDGPWTTSRPRWTTMAAWLGEEQPRLDERTARGDLLRLWLRSFGPATVTDVKWWLGAPVRAVRTAVADAAAVEVDLHGQAGVALPEDLEPAGPVEPWAALLPALDPTTMGWAERDWYLGPHRPMLFDSTGNAGPTAWWDGRVVGGWHQSPAGEVVVDLLEPLPEAARHALGEEAGRLTDWLSGVLVRPRFPPPARSPLATVSRAG